MGIKLIKFRIKVQILIIEGIQQAKNLIIAKPHIKMMIKTYQWKMWFKAFDSLTTKYLKEIRSLNNNRPSIFVMINNKKF